MSKRKIVSAVLAVIFTASYISSCKSIETQNVNTAADTVQSSAEIVTIAGADFGGVLYESAPVTAASAAPIPANTFEHTQSGTADEPSGEDTTTTTSGNSSGQETGASSSAETTKASTTAPPPRETSPEMVIRETTAETTSAPATTAGTTTTSVAETSATTAATTAETTKKTEAETLAAPTVSYTAGSYPKNSYKALNYAYVQAVWISYIELTSLYGKSESDFTASFAKMMDNCASLGINTVYVHARAFGDAYYYSDLFPFTKQFSGVLGKRTSYDPMKIMVSEAHKRNISFHAWINPLRLCVAGDMPAVSTDYPIGKWYNGTEKGTYIVNINGTYFLNPAYDEVRKLIGDNVREIVSKYDVDGIHIDDYFYPTTDVSFDSAAYSGSGYSSIGAFRIDKCNAMVKEMYTAAHECGSVMFGAAPQGNNNNNLNVLYADTKAWAKGGYIDYFTPQIYYGFENSGVPFAGNVDEWLTIVAGTNIKLYPGLSVYKIGNEDKWAGAGKYEWQNTTTMLKRQKEYADKAGCNGIALYSYNYLFSPSYSTAAMQTEISNLKPLMTQ